ncbi:hypothetical protein FSARC_3347 [Fusarium sarcochroum]|uniref:Tautomerase cis-CaaD-like domain-containing protein n=1 Tax=Fusarium sarcochroum TaxID=1208366 RepID=A0A8H4U498_9HYPO|nr:hypothetical protein FSARC_3347 [Fusarium sarcochroum]
MPLYEISHAAPLTLSQKTSLAEVITDIHSNAFHVPRWYINVVFTDASLQQTFVGGRPRSTNRITARVRNGGSRSKEAFQGLCSDIDSAWRRIVHPEIDSSQLPPRELELGAIFIAGKLLAGLKVGFPVPTAGDEMAWAKEHFASFKKRAELGDEDFIEYVADLEKKPEFRDLCALGETDRND